MRSTFASFLSGLFLLIGTTAAMAAPGSSDAAWNGSSKDKGSIGFWIYEKEGSCEDMKSAQPLRIGIKNLQPGSSSGPLQVKDLFFCLLFVSDPTPANPDGVTSNCASGSIDFSFDATAGEYRGKYNFTMNNKAVRRGQFRAQSCKSAAPTKN